MATKNKIYDEMKVVEESLKATYAGIDADENLSKNTKHTKAHSIRRDLKFVRMILKLSAGLTADTANAILNDKVFKEDFGSIINPGTHTKIIIEAGDSAIKLSQKYPNQSFNALLDKAAKAGLKFDASTMTFVR
jgi:hypothetical protein